MGYGIERMKNKIENESIFKDLVKWGVIEDEIRLELSQDKTVCNIIVGSLEKKDYLQLYIKLYTQDSPNVRIICDRVIKNLRYKTLQKIENLRLTIIDELEGYTSFI